MSEEVEVSLNVRCSSGEKHEIKAKLSLTVLELKENVLASVTSVPAGQQRLIYKGRVLKDEQTLSSYGVEEGHTIHFVKGRAAATPPPPSTTTPATTAASPSASNPWASMMGAGAGGGNSSMEAMQRQMLANPEMMSQMMNSPMMQSVMNNPDIMRNMMQSNPAMRQVLDSNPQLNHILNDPELLRQSMEAVRNPAAMREMMRSQDTAMRNVESHPEGFNALRRMYQDVQEPLMNAQGSGMSAPTSSFPMPGAPSRSAETNSNTAAPVQNPWAAPNTTSTTTATPNAAATNPWANAAGGGGTGNLEQMNAMSQAMANMMQNNPALQSQVQAMLSNPETLRQMTESNPQLRAMMDANPQMQQMMSNPETLQALMNPQNLQAMMQFQQSMQQLSQSGLMPGGGGTGGGAGSNAGGGANLFNALNMMGGATPGGSGTFSPPSVSNPEELYASQILQLNDMGFTNREQNIRALQQTMGNVNAAVERILGGSA